MAPIRSRYDAWVDRHPNQVIIAVFVYITFTFGGLVGGGFYFLQRAQTDRARIEATAEQSHRALCSLRADLSTRVESTKTFLADHPEGIPGISRADLELSIRNQQRTIDALVFLNCSE